jgi:AcrR family transcriptional regulator
VKKRWIEMSTQVERSRLLDAMLEEMAEKGYNGTAVEAALQRAGLDRNGYLVEFVDKDTSLFAAYEQLTERLRRTAAEGCAVVAGRWPERVRRGLAALLKELAAQPEQARVLTHSFPASGPEARARYQSFVEGLAPLLREGREYAELGDELPAEVEMLAVGAAEAIVFEEIASGRTKGLPALGPEILFSMLVPFVGPEAASAEMEAARKAADRSDLEVA